MEEVCTILGVIAVVATVTVIGHGLWLVIAGLFRVFFGTQDASSSPSLSKDPNQRILDDLAAANRLVGYAKFKGWLNGEQIETLQHLLRSFAERQSNSRVASSTNTAPASIAAELNTDEPVAASITPFEPIDSEILPSATVKESKHESQQYSLPQVAQPLTHAPIGLQSVAVPLVPTAQLNTAPLHPLEQPEPLIAAAPIAPPRPITADLLKTFMERSNIRWIEIVSAALIVVGSVGLVISLWSTLSETSRYFPSLVFLLATVAVHGAGQYTLRKWKLRSTSRGILQIGLMLIPLSVLVGILLSRRPDVTPELDPFTIGVLGIGTLVYGTLAITASRALFASRWLPISVAVIIGSMTLVPIHFLAARELIQFKRSAVTLVPLILVSLFNVLQLSSFASLPVMSAGRMRRVASQVLQVIFAALVPCGFWVMQSRGLGLSHTATACGGLLLAGWASWGWTASLKNLVRRFDSASALAVRKSSGLSWYVVLAWCLAGACSLALGAIVWQAMDNRNLLAGSLFVLALWWFIHGMRCGLLTSLLVASSATVVSLGMFAEGRLSDATNRLEMADWLSFSRVGSLSVSGILIAGLGVVLAMVFARSRSTEFGLKAIFNSEIGLRASLPKLPIGIVGGAAMILLLTAGLTTLASLTSISQPAYGGNWAPLMLLGYGVLLMIVSIAKPALIAQSTKLLNLQKGAMVLGQAILLLAVVKLCHSAPRLPAWLIDLRPRYAWAIGTGGLALAWAALAAVLRSFVRDASNTRNETTQFQIQSLSIGGIALAVASSLAYWFRDDHWTLAASVGWILPVTLGLAFVALRIAMLREFTLLGLSAWVLSATTAVGVHYQWWSNLGLPATLGVLALVELAILWVNRWTMERDSTGTPESVDWRFSGDRWASGSLLNLTWLAVTAGVAAVGFLQLYLNLNGNYLPEKFFESAPMTWQRTVIIAAAYLVLAVFTYTLRPSRWIATKLWLSVLPVAVAILIGTLCNPPLGLPVALWIVAAIVVVLELLPTRLAWGQHLAEQEQKASFEGLFESHPYQWLRAMLTLSRSVLVVGTTLVFLNYTMQGLPELLVPNSSNAATWSGWLSNVFHVCIWALPLWLALAVRWMRAVVTGAATNKLVALGYSCGGVTAFIATFAGAFEWQQLTHLALQSFSLAMLLVSMVTLGFTMGRNWLGLRQLDKKSSALAVLSKARKGARYRQAEQASWSLWIGAIVPAALICAGAAVMVSVYPRVQSTMLNYIGSLGTLAIVGFAVAMGWLLAIGRDWSKFGLLAITLGLLSPLVAASYASWLIDHPQSRFEFAGNYEPVRLQIGLWLISLAVALAIRIYCTATARKMSSLAETSWIALATVVGGLSIYGMSDSGWAAGQLLVLSAIIVMSGEVSGQSWRGYLAAFAAMVAWLPWMVRGMNTDGPFFVWQSLVSVVAVAVLAMVVRWLLRWRRIEVVQQFSWTIDRSSILFVSIIAWPASGFWTMWSASAGPTSNWVVGVIIGMSVGVLALAVTRLWESKPGHRGLGVYVSLIALVLVVVQAVCWRIDAATVYRSLSWWSSMLGAMTVLAILLRLMSQQPNLMGSLFNLRQLATPERLTIASRKMSVFHTVVALFCLVPSVWLVLTMSQETLRLAAIALPLLGAAAIWPISFQDSRAFQRGSVVLLASATLVLAWWADLPSAWRLRQPHESWLFVQRAFLAMTLLSVLYPVINYIRKRQDAWAKTLNNASWICLGISLVVGLALVLGTSLGYWESFPAETSLAARVMCVVGWGVLFSRLLQLAAWPGSLDGLTFRQRTSAVYIAEISIALASVTIYFLFPNLFHGRFANWWPIIMFAIAFGSTVLGQWLKKIDLPVLADPVSRSSLLLPILPLAGVWAFQPERATVSWSEFDRFAVLLVIGSSLYGLHGWVRGSLGLRALSGALALLGFWSFLHHHPNLRFFEHPQFWLLPPALGSLMFVEWNKSRLESSVVTSVRYVAILIAYFSSTSELFFKSFAGSLWPPMVLLTLALAGIAAGIVLKIKPFLFCGAAFTVVSLIGMTRNAAQAIDQNWPWWVFCIAIGVSLITMLAYFEKNRPRVVAYLEELKQWN